MKHHKDLANPKSPPQKKVRKIITPIINKVADHNVGDHADEDNAVADDNVGEHPVADHVVGDHDVGDHADEDNAVVDDTVKCYICDGLSLLFDWDFQCTASCSLA